MILGARGVFQKSLFGLKLFVVKKPYSICDLMVTQFLKLLQIIRVISDPRGAGIFPEILTFTEIIRGQKALQCL